MNSPGEEAREANLTAAKLIDLERAQIGHDLHDLLLPLIFAASANLQPLLDRSRSEDGESPIDESVLRRVADSDNWLREALQVGRSLLTQIYPAELEQLPWLSAAQDAVAKINGFHSEIIWKVDPSSPVNDPNWNRDVAAAAYRVLVESVRNAKHHGNAECISVRCDPVAMTIVDDGDGFDPDQVPTERFGIRSMKGRAQIVGKTVTVESEIGGPTMVRMTL